MSNMTKYRLKCKWRDYAFPIGIVAAFFAGPIIILLIK